MGAPESKMDTTHMANGYHEAIWVRIDADRNYVTDRYVSVSGDVSTEDVSAGVSVVSEVASYWERTSKAGFTKVAPGDYLGFNPDSDRGMVYIDVVTDSGKVICMDFPQRSDYSVKVNSAGYLKEVVYGSIWEEL